MLKPDEKRQIFSYNVFQRHIQPQSKIGISNKPELALMEMPYYTVRNR